MSTTSQTQQADALLSKISAEHQGKLTIFIGAAPGVGKTYAMLSAARECLQQGTDVIVGLVETHNRKETENMLVGFEALPRKELNYHSALLSEFDLDAAIKRRPSLILVDELAHTNIPGSRHKRRYQDIAELLAAGIDVYTTVNIQHLVSVNDLVLQITGVRVKETVPDNFVDEAFEIRFIDLPPDTLIERLQQGKVYLPEYARSAIQSFFSVSNLTALRELAMRKVIERVDAKLINELDAKASGAEFILKDKLLVLISNNSDHQYLIRIGRQIAERRQIAWLVVWVDTGKVQSIKRQKRLNDAFTLAKELGAKTTVLKGSSCYQSVLPFISEQRINTVLVGAGKAHKFRFWRRRLYQRLVESKLPLEVSVFHNPEQQVETAAKTPATNGIGNIKGHLYGIAAVSGLSLLALLLQHWMNSSNLVLLYVLAIVGVGLRYGARPAIATAIWSFLCFNFFLTEPKYTLSVYSHSDIATLIFLMIIGLICGPAASRIRHQFLLLAAANRNSETLRSLAQRLTVADDASAVWKTLSQEMTALLQTDCSVICDQEIIFGQHLQQLPRALQPTDQAAIDWTLKNGKSAGHFTDTLSGSSITVLPINAKNRCIAAVLIFWPIDTVGFTFKPDDQEMAQAMLQQAVSTWQRVQLVSDLESARVKTEVEQLRSALLSSVSHDLKSPLSAMMGAAESLKLFDESLNKADRFALQDTILQESRRLDTYIQNLLDMTRLGYGTLKIERDWVSAEDIISSALNRLRRYFPDVRTDYQQQGKLPLLYVHPALIEQALFNILENAARFSPASKPVVVTATVLQQQCKITIEDQGPGIPAEQRDKIFDMFYMVAGGDQKKQNTGMGLAICKGMIGAHGGQVSVAERSGGGTRFEITLPLDYKDPQHLTN